MIYYVYVPDIMDSDPNKQAKKRTYICKNCHTVTMSVSQPSLFGCPTASRNHAWYYSCPIGIRPRLFTCRICGLRINSSLTPSTPAGVCEGGKNHQFY